MIWKECSGAIVSRNLLSTIVTSVFLLAAIGGLGYLAYYVGAPAFIELLNNGYGGYQYEARDDLNAAVRVLTAALYVLLLFMLAGVAATSFTSEREKDTWVSLIGTPLEAGEIITGKFLGALWRVRFVLGLLVLCWLFGLALGAIHPLAFLLIVGLTVMDAMFVAAVGCSVSLRMTSSARAIAVTVGTLLFAKGGYMFCCIPIFRNGSADTSLFAIGLTPFLVTFATATYNEVHEYLFTGNHYWADWMVTGVVCLMVHSFIIVMLGLESTNRFEIVADRPNRSTELIPQIPGKLDDRSKADGGDELLA
jgi:ABC-type Na+ efflux pump permease subunit